jgi:3-methyladenine DNA glycosylase AlkD
MTVEEIMTELRSKGSDGIRRIFLKHGIKDPMFGVKIEYLKLIQKKIKMDYQLAKDLYETGNADAMYLAGLIADDKKMTISDLQNWARKAVSNNISEYTVPWVAAGSLYGYELALDWIDAPEEYIAAAGWATLAELVSLRENDCLDAETLKPLLARVVTHISTAKNRVRYVMNKFVIAAGIYEPAITNDAMAAAKKIGQVSVDMNGTACKVPDAAGYILKIKEKGTLGKKKKTVKC